MNLPLLYELQNLYKEMNVIEKSIKELLESKDLTKLKEEHRRLRTEYFKREEKLKKNAYQQEIRNNEIKNLDYSRKASEVIKFSRDTDTVKKLDNIEKQLEKLEEKKLEAENDVIVLIDEADNINKELVDIKKRLAFIKKKYISSKEGTDRKVVELKAEKNVLGSQIDDLIKKIDKESFGIFSKLIKEHTDPVALVEKRTCGGCKMEVPAMDYDALKNGSREIRCQSCGRILYFRKP